MSLAGLKELAKKLKTRFLISGHHMPYLPAKAIDYRFPAPVDQPKPMIPRTSPEKGYDTTYFSRHKMQGTPYASAAAYDEAPLAPDEMPRHIPMPVWWNAADVKGLIAKYEPLGFMPSGKFYDYRKAGGYVPSYLDHGHYLTTANRVRQRPVLAYAKWKAAQNAHAQRISAQKAQWANAAAAAADTAADTAAAAPK